MSFLVQDLGSREAPHEHQKLSCWRVLLEALVQPQQAQVDSDDVGVGDAQTRQSPAATLQTLQGSLGLQAASLPCPCFTPDSKDTDTPKLMYTKLLKAVNTL